jgi:hypothetical protein
MGLAKHGAHRRAAALQEVAESFFDESCAVGATNGT